MRVVFLYFLLLYHSAYAQYEHLLHKDYKERGRMLSNFWETKTINDNYDSTKFFDEVLTIRKLAIEHDDEGLEMDTYMMELSFFLYRKKYKDNLVVSKLELDKVLQIAREKQLLTEASVEKHFGLFYFSRVKNYELAFEHYLNMYEIIKDKKPTEFPDKVNCINQLTYAYYHFAEYDKVIQYAQTAIDYEETNRLDHYLFSNYVFVGNCFRYLGQLDSAKVYYEKAYQNALGKKQDHAIGLARGYLGYLYYLQNEFEKAVPLLNAGLQVAEKYPLANYRGLWSVPASVAQLAENSILCVSSLSNLEIKKGHLKRAGELMQKAKKYQQDSGEFALLEILYPSLARLATEQGQHRLATLYLDSLLFVKDSLHRQFNTRKLLRAQQKADLKRQRDQIETQRKEKVQERNLYLIGVGMILGLVMFAYFRQRKVFLRRLKVDQQHLVEKETQLLNATEQLRQFASNISEKSKLIEELQKNPDGLSSQQALSRLQQSTIITDTEWETFRHLFEQVHEGYLQRLKEKYPQLTPAEVRFITLTKLQLSKKEMTFVLGVSAQNIRTIWYRLRKKLSLAEDITAEELAESV
ncbi:tetratricopeptide repeat protein [Runella zeae]|jgi:tetratricopeptide (TPR) repeat protein|uniref:tetratricopeptide repeat protein n=1 Tax=Runella zeae TaxID=94255 RepID=UPI000429C7D9|nr:tetratricopeptide repeat protein [Runella zeae]